LAGTDASHRACGWLFQCERVALADTHASHVWQTGASVATIHPFQAGMLVERKVYLSEDLSRTDPDADPASRAKMRIE